MTPYAKREATIRRVSRAVVASYLHDISTSSGVRLCEPRAGASVDHSRSPISIRAAGAMSRRTTGSTTPASC
jgi:hypothetical protein